MQFIDSSPFVIFPQLWGLIHCYLLRYSKLSLAHRIFTSLKACPEFRLFITSSLVETAQPRAVSLNEFLLLHSTYPPSIVFACAQGMNEDNSSHDAKDAINFIKQEMQYNSQTENVINLTKREKCSQFHTTGAVTNLANAMHFTQQEMQSTS